jgi:hypothetical protein
MIRKDYIQRQFEEFGKVLASLLSLKKNRDWEAFEKEIELASQTFTSFELKALEELSLDDFEKKIQSTPLAYDHKKMLASLLFEHMNAYQERGETEHYEQLKKKCFVLYTALAEDLTHNEFDLETHYRIKLLQE